MKSKLEVTNVSVTEERVTASARISFCCPGPGEDGDVCGHLLEWYLPFDGLGSGEDNKYQEGGCCGTINSAWIGDRGVHITNRWKGRSEDDLRLHFLVLPPRATLEVIDILKRKEVE